MWETDQEQPTRQFAVPQGTTSFSGQRLLLDGQQRLTSLSAVLRGDQIQVRGCRRPIDILFNLGHPEGSPFDLMEIEADEESLLVEDDEPGRDDEVEETSEPGIQERLRLRTFVVASGVHSRLPTWIPVAQVFACDEDAEILRRAGIGSVDEPRFKTYSGRLQRLRKIRDYPYVMHVLPRQLAYEEITDWDAL